MKNLSLTICSVFTLLFLTIPVHAQESAPTGMPVQERAELQTQRMKEILQLDSLQVTKVEAINLRYARQMDPIISGSGSRLSKMRAYRQVSALKEKELEKVLSKDQFKRFKQQQQAVKEQLKKRKS